MDSDTSRYVQEPHPHDILTAENGKKVHANHQGNLYFLKLLVADYNEWVTSSEAKGEGGNRAAIEKAWEASGKRVIEKIRSRNPPGRFLRQEETLSSLEERQQASKSKLRWEIMEDEESISTSIAYLEKVLGELEKRERTKMKSNKRSLTLSREREVELHEQVQIKRIKTKIIEVPNKASSYKGSKKTNEENSSDNENLDCNKSLSNDRNDGKKDVNTRLTMLSHVVSSAYSS